MKRSGEAAKQSKRRKNTLICIHHIISGGQTVVHYLHDLSLKSGGLWLIMVFKCIFNVFWSSCEWILFNFNVAQWCFLCCNCEGFIMISVSVAAYANTNKWPMLFGYLLSPSVAAALHVLRSGSDLTLHISGQSKHWDYRAKDPAETRMSAGLFLSYFPISDNLYGLTTSFQLLFRCPELLLCSKSSLFRLAARWVTWPSSVGPSVFSAAQGAMSDWCTSHLETPSDCD